MSVRFHGTPPYAVVLLHGGPGAVGALRPLAEYLGARVGVLEQLQTGFTLETQIAEAGRDIREHAAGAVTVIGHSWGAWLGWLLAARSPELVRKLVMIGTPPLQEPWADVVTNERIRRLSPCESAEFKRLVDFFNGCPDHDSDAERARLGELAAKADAYDEVSAVTDDPAAPSGIAVARMFSRVWREAVALRRSGDLVKEGNRIRCPVVAIHGDHDPHPVEGVRQPAAEVLADFRLVLLERCGHTPWRERHASDLLFRTLQREIVKAGADHEKEAHDDRHRDT